MPLRVMVIVEGHGEAGGGAVLGLFQRIWYEHLQGDYIEIVPWRCSQGRILSEQGLREAVRDASVKLHSDSPPDYQRLLMIMVDTEGKDECCPKTNATELVKWAREERSDTEICCVMPNVMFETWFAAAAESLRGVNGLPQDLPRSFDPEGEGLGKSWIKKHLKQKYKETIDQARFVARMSIQECLASSRSFRKLVKELQSRLTSDKSPAIE